jgi:hypothetical protein
LTATAVRRHEEKEVVALTIALEKMLEEEPTVVVAGGSDGDAPGGVSAWRRDRDLRIVDGVVNEGRTLQDVGDEFGMTRERVRQIVLEYEPSFATERRRERHQRQALEAAVSTVRAMDAARSTVARAGGPVERRFSDEDLLRLLREWTAEHGREPSTVSWTGQPTVTTFVKRFGSWTEAKRLAGVGTADGRSGPRVRRWSDEEVVETVLEFLLSEPDNPKARFGSASYMEWRRARKPSAPSLSTIILQMGPWSSVKRRAIEAGVARGLFESHGG